MSFKAKTDIIYICNTYIYIVLLFLFREFYVTLSKDSQTEDKIQGSMTVLHEILHQWFGNMVTTPWWDHAWFNEGMCNYLNYYITSIVSMRLGI